MFLSPMAAVLRGAGIAVQTLFDGNCEPSKLLWPLDLKL